MKAKTKKNAKIKTKRKKMNFSNVEDMKVMEECVKARDAYLNYGGFLNLKDFWAERGFGDKYGITYSSYHMYARGNTTKRRKLNTRLGSQLGGESMLDAVVAEAMQQEEAEPEEPDAAMVMALSCHIG